MLREEDKDKTMNADSIQFQCGKGVCIIGIILVIMGAFCELGAISSIFDGGEDCLLIFLMLSLLFTLPLLGIGFGCIAGYFKNKKMMTQRLEEFGEERIRSHIQYGTLKAYYNKYSLTSIPDAIFTDKLLIMRGSAIVTYQEICAMYRREYRGVPSLVVRLFDGRSLQTCTNCKGDEMVLMMQIAVQRNPGILLGYTSENLAAANRKVSDYKKGLLTVPSINLELLTGPITQPSGQGENDGTASQSSGQNGNAGNLYEKSSNAVSDYIIRNFTVNQKIMAIKYYREQTGVGLAEAKNVVDSLF